MRTKTALIAATLCAAAVGITACVASPTQGRIENCKTPTDAPTHSVCVWTEDETRQFAVGVRYLADGKPANSVPVTMRQTTSGVASYTCETATAGGLALCEFAPNAATTLIVRANVGGVEFI